ncbi:MAG: hydrogenase iron-sulfur subunit [Thermoplasmatota archaeon]
MTDFEPKILAFCCNWCAYAGADLAGVGRIQYPPNVRIVRVMCSGRVDMAHIVAALRSGADGVLIAGCHPGDCHYISGNESAKARVNFLRAFLEEIGVERERVRLEWVAGSEGGKFARVVQEMVEQLRALGPMRARLEAGESGGTGA